MENRIAKIKKLNNVRLKCYDQSIWSNQMVSHIQSWRLARSMDDRFKAILAIYSDDHPLGGPCLHHFWRHEYQQRVMDHFHMVAWINNAPIWSIVRRRNSYRFIMRVVSCSLPDKKNR